MTAALLHAIGVSAAASAISRSGSAGSIGRILPHRNAPITGRPPPPTRSCHSDKRATYAGPRKLVISTAGKREFYDLQTDPGERRNILQLEGNAAKARGLESDLAQWLKKIPRQTPGKTPKMDNATLERLKSLGYVQ